MRASTASLAVQEVGHTAPRYLVVIIPELEARLQLASSRPRAIFRPEFSQQPVSSTRLLRWRFDIALQTFYF
jgi:hypothetical protein